MFSSNILCSYLIFFVRIDSLSFLLAIIVFFKFPPYFLHSISWALALPWPSFSFFFFLFFLLFFFFFLSFFVTLFLCSSNTTFSFLFLSSIFPLTVAFFSWLTIIILIWLMMMMMMIIIISTNRNDNDSKMIIVIIMIIIIIITMIIAVLNNDYTKSKFASFFVIPIFLHTQLYRLISLILFLLFLNFLNISPLAISLFSWSLTLINHLFVYLLVYFSTSLNKFHL